MLPRLPLTFTLRRFEVIFDSGVGLNDVASFAPDVYIEKVPRLFLRLKGSCVASWLLHHRKHVRPILESSPRLRRVNGQAKSLHVGARVDSRVLLNRRNDAVCKL